MTKTITFISLFRHSDATGRRYISGVFTGADGESRTAFSFPGLKNAIGSAGLRPKTDSRGVPYATTPFPIVVEYAPYGDGLADVLGVTGRPSDTKTAGLLDAALSIPAAPAAPAAQTAAVPPPAVA